jgi:hypothetical protein
MFEKLKQHRIIVGTVVFLFLLIAVPVTVNFLQKQQETRSRAAGEAVAVKLDPLTANIGIGEDLVVTVTIDGKQNDISAVDITFSYSPELELVSDGLDTGGVVSSPFSTITNDASTSGSIRYVGVNPTSNPIQGSNIYVGQLRFRGKTQGDANVGFSHIHINASGVEGALPIDTDNTRIGLYTINEVTASPTAVSSPTPTPFSIDKRLLDFNDDGIIDEIDLNILLSSFRTREGD